VNFYEFKKLEFICVSNGFEIVPDPDAFLKKILLWSFIGVFLGIPVTIFTTVLFCCVCCDRRMCFLKKKQNKISSVPQWKLDHEER
jgi:hypothetical protein